MTIEAFELKEGERILVDGEPKLVLMANRVKLGKGPTYVFASVRGLGTGEVRELKFSPTDRVVEWPSEEA